MTDNFQRMGLDPGSNRSVLVPQGDAGNTEAVKVRVESTNPQQPIRFGDGVFYTLTDKGY